MPKTDSYTQFLQSKRILAPACGFDVPDSDINPMLFPFQRDITRWALKRGKAAIFAHTGLGKGPMQLEWGAQVSKHTGKPVMIVAPLAVAQQEGAAVNVFALEERHVKMIPKKAKEPGK